MVLTFFLKIILGLFFPPTLYSLEFKTKEELELMPQTEEEYILEKVGAALEYILDKIEVTRENRSSIRKHTREGRSSIGVYTGEGRSSI